METALILYCTVFICRNINGIFNGNISGNVIVNINGNITGNINCYRKTQNEYLNIHLCILQ